MAVKTKPTGRPTFKAKAKEVLAFARKQIRAGRSPAELYIVIFGAHGKINVTFPTKAEREAFRRSEEYEATDRLIKAFLEAPSQSGSTPSANGHFCVTLRLPKSIHATLTKEAEAEGVSLDQLCLSKLVAQLRELV